MERNIKGSLEKSVEFIAVLYVMYTQQLFKLFLVWATNNAYFFILVGFDMELWLDEMFAK